MKNFLTKLSILGLSLMFAVTGYAQTGMFYNPDRSGEGIVVTMEGDTLAFAFFTHFDPRLPNEIVPVVSPRPPDTVIIMPFCAAEVTEVEGKEIPPVVSPKPPEGEDVDTTLYGGVPIWYIGYGVYADGVAIGKMYLQKPISYPYSFDGLISDEYVIATFMITDNGDGFELQLDCYDNLPSKMYMCNNVMTFNQRIIGQ